MKGLYNFSGHVIAVFADGLVLFVNAGPTDVVVSKKAMIAAKVAF